MSYPVDPSEVYELRREVEELRERHEQLVHEIDEERRRRKKAEKTAREYAGANARALRVIAMLTDGPVLNEIARDRVRSLEDVEVTFSGTAQPWPGPAGVGEIRADRLNASTRERVR